MRILVSIAALATAAMIFMPAPSAEAGGLYARDRGAMWCPFDWSQRDRARVAAAPAVAGAVYTRDRTRMWGPFDWFRRDRAAAAPVATVRPRR